MAPPVEPPSAITLRVKVPPGHISGSADEFTLGRDVPVTIKLSQIRERIQAIIPSSPEPARQRLLYGGRALVDNEQTLADALNIRRDPTQDEYVIHLLIKGDGSNTSPHPHATAANTSARPGQPSAHTGAGSQLGQAPGPHPHNHPRNFHPPALRQPLLQQQAAALAHQQRMQILAMNNATQNRFSNQPMMPHMNFGGSMHPMQFPPQNGIPPDMQQGVQQVGGQGAQAPDGTQDPVADNTPTPDHNSAQTQASSPGPSTNGQNQARSAPDGQRQPTSRPVSNQGFHVEGIGPNGERITIHQQTLSFPHNGPPGQHLFPGAHTMATPSPFGMPPFQSGASQPLPQYHEAALARARENLIELRRMLEELRRSLTATEAERAQYAELEQRALALNDYIDPHDRGTGSFQRLRSRSPRPPNGGAQNTLPPLANGQLDWQQWAQRLRQSQQQMTQNFSNVTCYLLSSPSGPQALLHSPQHGAYTGVFAPPPADNSLRPTPTSTSAPQQTNAAQNFQGPGAQPAQQAPGQENNAQPLQQPFAAPEPDPLGPLGPLLNHLWLLLRILIFVYFLLGANMGWRRPLALLAIGIGFGMIRMGLLGDGGALRRWWDGIMNDGRQRPAVQQAVEGQQPNQQQGQDPQQPQPPAANGRAAQMPTPEQLAQRLLEEDERRRNDWYLRLRERFRPVERAIVLMVASLWPGVGEAYVRAREQEERQRAEAEIAARRREEEGRQRVEEQEKQSGEPAVKGQEKLADAGTETSPEPTADSSGSAVPNETPASAA